MNILEQGTAMYNKLYSKIATLTAAAVLAIFAGALCLKLNIAPTYSDFIVGNIAWQAESKLQDLLAIPIVILVLFGALLFLPSWLRQQQQVGGQLFAQQATEQLMLWSMPTVIILLVGLLGTPLDPRFLALSAAGIMFVCLKSSYENRKQRHLSPANIGVFFLAILMLLMVPYELNLLLGRLPETWGWPIQLATKTTNKVAAIFFILGLLSFWIPGHRLKPIFNAILGFGQLGLACWYLAIIPARLIEPNGMISSYPYNLWLVGLALSLLGVTIVDSVWRIWKHRKNDDWHKQISPWAFFGLIIAFKLGQTNHPVISPDDYHFGEMLLGYWNFSHGALPFVEHISPHGLIEDDFPQALSFIFYDGSAATILESSRLATLLLSLLAFLTMFFSTESLLLATVSTLLCSARISWFVFALIASWWFSPSLQKKPWSWLTVWLLSIPLLALVNPGQGVPLAVGGGIMAAYLIYRLYQQPSPPHGRNLFWISSTCLLLLMFLTPCGPMMLGVLSYLRDNGPINQVAYGVPWMYSWNNSKVIWVLELCRNAWVLAPLVALFALKKWREGKNTPLLDILPIWVVAIFTLLVLPYTMGRVDPFSASRPGLITMLALLFLLPLALWPRLRHGQKHALILLAAGLCAPINFGFMQFSLDVAIRGTEANIHIPALRHTAGTSLHNIGRAAVDEQSWQRLQALSTVLDKKLPPQAPYLNLSSRNAQHFYLNRPSSLAVSAMYNMASPSQQKRTIAGLELAPPKVALLEDRNIIHDGGGLALRNPYLYKYVLKHYKPSLEQGFVLGTWQPSRPDSASVIHSDIHNLTDTFWIQGFNRQESAIILEDQALSWVLRPGDEVRFGDGDIRHVVRAWPEGQAIWLDGQPMQPSPQKALGIHVKLNAKQNHRYEAELAQQAFSRTNLEKIPTAWGRSWRSLQSKMRLIKTISPSEVRWHDIQPQTDYQVTGTQPWLDLTLAEQKSTEQQADLLTFNFSCSGRQNRPVLEIRWRESEQNDLPSSALLTFTAETGRLIVPLDSQARWSLLNEAQQIRLQPQTPSDCDHFRIDNIALYHRQG